MMRLLCHMNMSNLQDILVRILEKCKSVINCNNAYFQEIIQKALRNQVHLRNIVDILVNQIRDLYLLVLVVL